mmetsp:Transcript_63570/g.129523  ORF Transcript_63570/g.129523 Transcript_63570/m.129523 type:complete len:139 (+) Transcript_63570:127-543(+)
MTSTQKIVEGVVLDDSSTTSTKPLVPENDDETDQEDTESDDCNSEKLSRPRANSSSSHFVLEKTRRNSGFGSKDPLFHGVCLYEGTMTTDQVKKYGPKVFRIDAPNGSNHTNSTRNLEQYSKRNRSWSLSFLNIFSNN